MIEAMEQSKAETNQEISTIQSTASSYYFYLAEISLRRLLNRIRNAATLLSPTIDASTANELDDILQKLENQP